MTASPQITREAILEQQKKWKSQVLGKSEAERYQLALKIYEAFGKDIEKKLNNSSMAKLRSYASSLPPGLWLVDEAKELLKQKDYVSLVIMFCINHAHAARALQQQQDETNKDNEMAAEVEKKVANMRRQFNSTRTMLRDVYIPSKYYSNEAYEDVPERITKEELASVDTVLEKAIQWCRYDWHLRDLTSPDMNEPKKDRGRPVLEIRNQA